MSVFRVIVFLIALLVIPSSAFALNMYDSSGNHVASGINASTCLGSNSTLVITSSTTSCSTNHFESGASSFSSVVNLGCSSTPVSFSTSYSSNPIVVASIAALTSSNTIQLQWAGAVNISTTGFTLYFCNSFGLAQTSKVNWISIGV